MKQLLLGLALSAPLALSACAGFQPMHATPATQTLFNDVAVQLDPGNDEADRELGFMVQQRLADRMGAVRADAPLRLVLKPRQVRVGLGLTSFSQASRFDSIASVRWELQAAQDGALIDTGSVRGTATYSASLDPYQLLSKTEQANERAANEAVDKLISDVTRALSDREKSWARRAAEAASATP